MTTKVPYKAPSFRVEVKADNSGNWASNGMLFRDRISAALYAKNLMARWTLVTDWQVVEVNTEVVVTSRTQYLNTEEQLANAMAYGIKSLGLH